MDGFCSKMSSDVGISIPLGGFTMGRPRTLDYDKIKEMYEQDCTLNEIARAVGSANHKSIGDAIERMGLPERPGHPQGKLDKQKDKIISDYLFGLSAEKVAKKYGGVKASVRELLIRNNVPMRSGAKRHDGLDRIVSVQKEDTSQSFRPTVEWFREQLTEHQTAAAIARHHKIPYGTLMDWAYKLGVEIPTWRGGPGGVTQRQDIPVEEATQLSNEGWTYEQLAEKYGVSYFVISKRMLEAGYRAPKNRMRKYPEDSVFASAPWRHRQLLEEMGIRQCEMCGTENPLAFCHIVPKRDGGPIAKDNALVLCLNDHHKFDEHMKHPERGLLTPEEFAKIRNKVEAAIKLYGKPKTKS